jgi:hypothetical protein
MSGGRRVPDLARFRFGRRLAGPGAKLAELSAKQSLAKCELITSAEARPEVSATPTSNAAVTIVRLIYCSSSSPISFRDYPGRSSTTPVRSWGVQHAKRRTWHKKGASSLWPEIPASFRRHVGNDLRCRPMKMR